jgi:hypothetical protein
MPLTVEEEQDILMYQQRVYQRWTEQMAAEREDALNRERLYAILMNVGWDGPEELITQKQRVQLRWLCEKRGLNICWVIEHVTTTGHAGRLVEWLAYDLLWRMSREGVRRLKAERRSTRIRIQEDRLAELERHGTVETHLSQRSA